MHTPALIRPAAQRTALGMSTLAFTVCFAVWTIFSIVGIQIKAELGLNDTELGLLLAFCVCMVWSVVVAQLPQIGFDYSTDQLFWLAALPGLSGATFRIFYAFMVPVFGGRLWTTLTTLSLLIPAFGIGYAVQSPDTPYVIFLVLALACGLGGGNYASSMANISFFFPKSRKGNALARAGTGWISDRIGGARVSLGVFLAMIVGAAGVLHFLGIKEQPGAFRGFFAMFMLLFVASGVGNASTTQMIPVIMRKDMDRLMPGAAPQERLRNAEKESAAVIGFTSAIAACGAFFIPKAYGTSIAVTGSPNGALWSFMGYYVICAGVTWYSYSRRRGLLHDIERARRRTGAPVAA